MTKFGGKREKEKREEGKAEQKGRDIMLITCARFDEEQLYWLLETSVLKLATI